MTARARLLLAAVACLLLGVDRPAGLGDVAGVRHWSYRGYTRVVIELNRPIESSVERLPSDPRAGRPERLYLDLPEVWVGLRYADPIPVGDGLLQGIRLGQNTLRNTRLVIDLESYQRHRLFTLTAPDRLVLDVYGRSRSPQTHPGPGGGPSHGGGGRLPVSLRPVHTIVVDAGHGGSDPGAVGVGGMREKDLTLEVARELERRLVDRGFRVVMTRTRDAFVSLEERTALAEGVGGDVFVSVHANSAPRRSASGIETYYLDRSHERHTLQVAARENGIPASLLDPLQRAVAGLRVSEVSGHSRELADTVHGGIVAGVRGAYGPVHDLGVKRGPFHVLFLSGAPSILVELGFLTNRGDAKRLGSGLYRAILAEQIARGLSRYRSQRATLLARRTP